MLSKKCILYLSVLCVVIFMLFVQKNMMAQADSELRECNTCKTINIPTPPGNSDYSQINDTSTCPGANPTIYASSATIDPSGTITLYVDSGGLARPNYSWSVSGVGYSLDKSITSNDLEVVTLTAPPNTGTCGTDYDIVATITVTDNCGTEVSVSIRNTAGGWGSASFVCGSSTFLSWVFCSVIEGKYKYTAHAENQSSYSTSTCEGNDTNHCWGSATACMNYRIDLFTSSECWQTPCCEQGNYSPGNCYQWTNADKTGPLGACGQNGRKLIIKSVTRQEWTCP